MPIIAKSSGNFTPAPAGAHSAVCCDVVDLGIVEITYAGETKKQHKIDICWQIEELRDDGKRFLIKKRYTLSLHEKAALRKDLESWRGRSFTEEELEGFDVEMLIGVPCMLSVIHESKNGKGPYANVSSLMKLPKGMIKVDVEDYVRVSEREPTQAEAVQPAWNAEITDDDIPF